MVLNANSCGTALVVGLEKTGNLILQVNFFLTDGLVYKNFKDNLTIVSLYQLIRRSADFEIRLRTQISMRMSTSRRSFRP